MYKIFSIDNDKKIISSTNINEINIEKIIWIDMVSPSIEEEKLIEKKFNLILPLKSEKEEIEISSRYWEENDTIEINTFFAINIDNDTINETVSFLLKDNILISIRNKKLHSFEVLFQRISKNPKELNNNLDILLTLLDIRIDKDADEIEILTKDINFIKNNMKENSKETDVLHKIAHLENINMSIRENLNDKQRILSSLLKSEKVVLKKEEIRIMLNDIKSLIEYINFNFERLEYAKNLFIGLLNIEQNKVIKIFTIVNVIFLPPTLIASIYGMNFKILPELSWSYGYLFSIILMITSSILPIWIFKKKNLI